MKPIMHCVTCGDFRDEECMWPECELAGEPMVIAQPKRRSLVMALVWPGIFSFGIAFWAALGWVVL